MQKNNKILIAGASGLVGSAIIRGLIHNGYTDIVGTFSTRRPDPELLLPDDYDIISSSSDKLQFSPPDSRLTPHEIKLYRADLRDQKATAELFQEVKPVYVFLAAAKVGGILANNTYRAEFIHDNLLITSSVINQSYLSGVKKLLNLGSTCIYPRDCPQPMQEEHLLTAPLEYTNEPYAIAKIAGLKMCESYNLQYGTNFISAMPTNLYGSGDNFDLEKAHVLPALMRKMHLAKLLEQGRWDDVLKDLEVGSREQAQAILDDFGVSADKVEIWGTGSPRREFLWSEDMADACVYLMENVDFQDLARDKTEVRNTHINIGSGTEISIHDLAYKVKETVGFGGDLYFNTSKPDGTPRKLTDVSRLHELGWRHKVDLDQGLQKFYQWYLAAKQ